MKSRSIAFATCQDYPLMDDDLLVVNDLKQSGLKVTPAIWDDESVNWHVFDLVVVRSPWDYFLKTEKYINWLKQFDNSRAKLLNPPGAIIGNIDKRYLLDFEQQGIPIIPSKLVEQNSDILLHDILLKQGWNKVVIKPVVSAGAHGTWVSNLDKSVNDQEKFYEQIKRESILIQPFMPEIVSTGEYSIIFIDGMYSHSVLKMAKKEDFRVQEEHGGTTISVDIEKSIMQQAQRILDIQDDTLLYARVDGVIRNGQFMLMELEINEPSLFFEFSKQAVNRFSSAIKTELSL